MSDRTAGGLYKFCSQGCQANVKWLIVNADDPKEFRYSCDFHLLLNLMMYDRMKVEHIK